jgi:hypothetical protein
LVPDRFVTCEKHGFQIIYELCLASDSIEPLSSRDQIHLAFPWPVLGLSRIEATSVQAVPQASSILASLRQAAFVWDLAADTIAWSDNAAAVFPKR